MEIPKAFQITTDVWMVPCHLKSNKRDYLPISKPFSSTFQSNDEKSRNVWKPEEDKVLSRLINSHGLKSWSCIAKELNILIHKSCPVRKGKQCRERWINHLNPQLLKHEWTEEEDQTIIILQQSLGNKWSEISRALNGRTENQVKNRWKSLKKTIEANSSGAKFNHRQRSCKRPPRLTAVERNTFQDSYGMVEDRSPYSLEDLENSAVTNFETSRFDFEYLEKSNARDLNQIKMLSFISDPDLNFNSGFELAQTLKNSKLELEYLCSDSHAFKDLNQAEANYCGLFADSWSLSWGLESENQNFDFFHSNEGEKESLIGTNFTDSSEIGLKQDMPNID